MEITIKGNPIPNMRARARIIKTGSDKDLIATLEQAMDSLEHWCSVHYVKKALNIFRGFKAFVSIYSAQKKETQEVRKQIIQQFDLKPFLTPLKLYIDFYIERPKSHYGTGRNSLKVKPSSPKYHIKRPDNDNMQKFIMDCMNGIVYKDDSQAVCVVAWKLYTSGEGKTVVTVEELE